MKPIILITGSSGLIGKTVMKALNDKYFLVGLDVKEPEEEIRNSVWMECDLTDQQNVKETLKNVSDSHGQKIASVIHLAAYYDFSGEPSEMYDKLTVNGTRHLLQELQTLDVGQVVFSSSLLVMDPVDEEEAPLTEDSGTHASWPYPESKLRAERVIREEHGDIPSVILRIAGVYTDHCDSLPLSQHIRRIYEKALESYFFPGNDEHGQPYVHLEDLANCFAQVVEKRTELGEYEVFLIAEPELLSHEQLQEQIGTLVHDREWPSIRIPKTMAKAGAWVEENLLPGEVFIKPWMVDLADDNYPVEIKKAREKLQWEPEHSLNNCLERMVKELKQDPRSWYERHDLPLPRHVK